MIRYPNISGKTDAQKLEQMQSYLHQLVDELNYQLDTSSNNSSSYSASVADKAAVAKSTKNDDAISNFNDIKALIIKSADIVNAYSEEINKKLEGQYVAESDFGTFKEATEAQLTASSQQINVVITKQENIDTDMEDLERTLRSEIEQTADSIKLEVTGGEPGNTASIKLTVGDKKYEGEIDLTGLVTFTSLATKGQTVINGSNITTGTILADLIKAGKIRSAVLQNTGDDGVGIDLDKGDIRLRSGNYDTRIVPNSLQSYYRSGDDGYRLGALFDSNLSLSDTDKDGNVLRSTLLGCRGTQYLSMIDNVTELRLELEVRDGRAFLTGLTAPVSDDDAVNKAYVDGKFLGRMRLLTSADDCNNIKDDGVYWYSTASVPANAPFANAAIIEVYGADNNTSQKIQRGTRYGAGGYSATRALYDNKWCEWYHYALTTNGVIPVSMGGTGGTTVATAQAGLQLTKDFIYSQTDSAGNKTLNGINAYPTSPGIYRVTTGSASIGIPGNYGCLAIFNGGGYYMHLYVNADGFWTARTTSMTAPTWKKMAVAT